LGCSESILLIERSFTVLDTLQQIDGIILFYILNHLHTPFGDWFFISVSSLGNASFIWIAITFLMLLGKKTRVCGILLCCALTFEFLLGNGILKPMIGRSRPFIRYPEIELLIKKPGGYSFPSGHTMSSFTAASTIFYSHKGAGTLSIILAGLIGYSRIYLFCHYPSDVLAGATLGISVSIMVIIIARKIELVAPHTIQ
jgi:undecaprenyl-diphosphatase